MKIRFHLAALVASMLLTPSFAGTVSTNECLAHWENHIFGDRMQMGGCALNDADMLELSKIVYLRHLKQLNLRNNNFTAKGLSNLASQDNKTIKILWLNQNKLTVEAIKELPKFKALEVVSLSQNDIGDEGVIALTANRYLNEVYLNDTNVKSIDAIKALVTSNLEVLSLKRNYLTGSAIVPLGESKRLKILYLNNNDIDSKGAVELSKNTSLRWLNLGHNKIDDVGIAAFAKNTTLERLSLHSNKITKAGVNVLAGNTTLKHINISYNAIEDGAIAKLAVNPSLELLDASFTGLGKASVMAIVANKSIKTVLMNGDHLDNSAAQQLAVSDIKSLSLSENDIGEVGGIALAHDTTLRQLNINKNHVGDNAALEFAKSTTLSELYIMYNGLTQIGMTALSQNMYFDVVWYGESINTIKKLYKKSQPSLTSESLNIG